MRPARPACWTTLAAAIASGALVTGCARRTTAGGLVVIVGTDVPQEVDALRFQVFEQGADGSWLLVRDQRLAVPQDSRLPTTFGILAGPSSAEVRVRVVAEMGGAPRVLREAQLSVPTDRLAELRLLACAVCDGSARVAGGDVQSACDSDGWSCLPDTGACGPEHVDASSLATYAPGDESAGDLASSCRHGGGSNADASLGDARDASPGDASGPLIWPNDASAANSDPWIAANHADIAQMLPRVLLLNFDNDTLDPARMASLGKVPPATRFSQLSAAFAEGSRYHGYASASTQPFLLYQLAKSLDLTDATATANSPYHNSTLLPRRASGCAPTCGTSNPYVFDYSALFTDRYASLYGFADPLDPTRALNLCELFQRGAVNEVWIYADSANGPDTDQDGHREYEQMYDAADAKIPGRFRQNFRTEDLAAVATCGVTIRMMGINPNRGVGCTVWADSTAMEDMFLSGSIASQQDAFTHFANFDFDTRLGAPFSSWYGACDFGSARCAAYPAPNSVQWTRTLGNGGTGVFDPFDQGCGNVHFPPNGAMHYDYGNTTPVDSVCEHFGLHDGPQGQDTKDTYTAMKVAALEQRFTECGGGWLVYWYQSFPGYANRATWHGVPIKNWWPYLFY